MIPQEITLPTNPHPLRGSLCLPDAATALVLLLQAGGVHPGCAHEDNAHLLAAQGFATLLVNLFSFRDPPGSDLGRNIPQLSQRILAVLTWLQQEPLTSTLPCTLLAGENAVPAALRAAAQRDTQVHALVCRGGLPDQAGVFYLESLACPVLLQQDTADSAGLASAQRAAARIGPGCTLQTWPTATWPESQASSMTHRTRSAGEWLRHKLQSQPTAQA